MTARLETIIQDIVSKLTSRLVLDFGEGRKATTNLTEDLEKLSSAQTPRIYVIRGAVKYNDDGANVPLVATANLILAIYVKQQKDASVTTQTLLNNAEQSVYDALIYNSTDGVKTHYITDENINYTITLQNAEMPIYAETEAFLNINLELNFRR